MGGRVLGAGGARGSGATGPLRFARRVIGAALELAVAALTEHLGFTAARAGVVHEQLAGRRGCHHPLPALDVAAVRVAGAADEAAEPTLAIQEGLAAGGAGAGLDDVGGGDFTAGGAALR